MGHRRQRGHKGTQETGGHKETQGDIGDTRGNRRQREHRGQ